jgi:hypothetical protein
MSMPSALAVFRSTIISNPVPLWFQARAFPADFAFFNLFFAVV